MNPDPAIDIHLSTWIHKLIAGSFCWCHLRNACSFLSRSERKWKKPIDKIVPCAQNGTKAATCSYRKNFPRCTKGARGECQGGQRMPPDSMCEHNLSPCRSHTRVHTSVRHIHCVRGQTGQMRRPREGGGGSGASFPFLTLLPWLHFPSSFSYELMSTNFKKRAQPLPLQLHTFVFMIFVRYHKNVTAMWLNCLFFLLTNNWSTSCNLIIEMQQ